MDTDKLSLRLTEINRNLERIADALEEGCMLLSALNGRTDEALAAHLRAEEAALDKHFGVGRQARKEKG